MIGSYARGNLCGFNVVYDRGQGKFTILPPPLFPSLRPSPRHPEYLRAIASRRGYFAGS